jgi:hypoxanthine phosphoribosyltransferase
MTSKLTSKETKFGDGLLTRPLFDANTIARRVQELGAQITRDYAGQSIVCVGVMKGALIFLADLVRSIDLPTTIEFIGVSSYDGTSSTGHVRLTHDLSADIKDRHVLLVEDIIDTGRTIDYLMDTLRVRGPKSLRVASFLSKPEAHVLATPIDYIGFEISKEFVIGYGLDLDQYYRNLPYVAQVIST